MEFEPRPRPAMSDLLRIAEDVVTDHAHLCDDLDTCACSMASLYREVRSLRANETEGTA